MFAARWRNERKRRKEKDKASDGGPTFYVVRRHRLGNALLGVVRRAIQEETISHTRAAKILGVSPASGISCCKTASAPHDALPARRQRPDSGRTETTTLSTESRRSGTGCWSRPSRVGLRSRGKSTTRWRSFAASYPSG